MWRNLSTAIQTDKRLISHDKSHKIEYTDFPEKEKYSFLAKIKDLE
jgi:hypothetical protein